MCLMYKPETLGRQLKIKKHERDIQWTHAMMRELKHGLVLKMNEITNMQMSHNVQIAQK